MDLYHRCQQQHQNAQCCHHESSEVSYCPWHIRSSLTPPSIYLCAISSHSVSPAVIACISRKLDSGMQTGVQGRMHGSTLAEYAGKFKSDTESYAHRNAAVLWDVSLSLLYSLLLLVNCMRNSVVLWNEVCAVEALKLWSVLSASATVKVPCWRDSGQTASFLCSVTMKIILKYIGQC